MTKLIVALDGEMHLMADVAAALYPVVTWFKAITRHLLDATFRERELRLKQEEHALGLRLLREVYGEADLRRMADLPEGWLPMTKHLMVITDRYDSVELTDPVRIPATQGRFTPSSPWCTAWEEHQNRRRGLKNERRSLEREVLGTLQAFRTIEKLADGWPEGYAHFPHPELAPTHLPALRIEDLNARIDAAKEAA